MKTDTHGSRLTAPAALATVLLLSGCATGTALRPPSQPLHDLPPVERPAAAPGDRYWFTNGRRERVTAVTADSIDVRRSSKYRYRLHAADPLLPARRVERRSGTTTTEILPLEASLSLWPLEVGRRTAFEVRSRKNEAAETRSGFWRCEVAGAERITVIAGEFDSYRIECQRRDSRNRIKQWVTRYFALDIGQVVLRIDRFTSKTPKKLELTAFTPDLSMLSGRSAKRYRNYFQQVMEQTPSGTSKSWWSRRNDTRIHITPTRTLSMPHRGYCRNYRLRIDHGGNVRRGAGLVCRDKDGRWRTPARVDPEQGFEFRT